jgi:hypothetical protein
MFWTFLSSFDVNILAIFGHCFGYLLKILVNFIKSLAVIVSIVFFNENWAIKKPFGHHGFNWTDKCLRFFSNLGNF